LISIILIFSSVILLIVISIITVFYYLIFIKERKRKIIDIDEEYEKKRALLYPPPFPNGWFSLCSASDVKKGQVVEVDALGQKFAVFRGEDGEVGIVDVYCPHLNANLADGCVKGNDLICPFHAWGFNKNGQCTHVPYSDKVPQNASVKSWNCKENWGLILVWYHAEGDAPSWSTEGYIPEVADYKFHHKTSDILRIHLQDFAENGADYAHFAYVHDLLTIPWAEYIIDIKHTLKIQFGDVTKGEGHMAWFTDKADLVWKKSQKEIPHAGGQATVTYYGPGFLVFQFNTKIGKMLLIKTFTPLGELKVRMEDYIYAPKGTFGLAIKYLLGEASAQFHDDIAIWEKKSYAERPALVKGDGPIMKMRAWYNQFYTASSYLQKQGQKHNKTSSVILDEQLSSN
jgi:cholesterol 7-dehydrogenase